MRIYPQPCMIYGLIGFHTRLSANLKKFTNQVGGYIESEACENIKLYIIIF